MGFNTVMMFLVLLFFLISCSVTRTSENIYHEKYVARNWTPEQVKAYLTSYSLDQAKYLSQDPHDIIDYIRTLSGTRMSSDMYKAMRKLKEVNNFNPSVVYDVGSNVLMFSKMIFEVWSNTTLIAFDGFETARFLYEEFERNEFSAFQFLYHFDILSNEDNRVVKFYENAYESGGNSYYKEVGRGENIDNFLFPEEKARTVVTQTLATVVKQRAFPTIPDLIKFDLQGADLDVILGSIELVKNARFLIVEIPFLEHNKNSPSMVEIILNLSRNSFLLSYPRMSYNSHDGDFGFYKLSRTDLSLYLNESEARNSHQSALMNHRTSAFDHSFGLLKIAIWSTFESQRRQLMMPSLSIFDVKGESVTTFHDGNFYLKSVATDQVFMRGDCLHDLEEFHLFFIVEKADGVDGLSTTEIYLQRDLTGGLIYSFSPTESWILLASDFDHPYLCGDPTCHDIGLSIGPKTSDATSLENSDSQRSFLSISPDGKFSASVSHWRSHEMFSLMVV